MVGRGESSWSEQGALPGAVVISVDAINQDEQDKLELENFARGLSAPAREDPGSKAYAGPARIRGRAMTPFDAVRMASGFVFAALAWWILSTMDLERSVSMGVGFGAFVGGLLFPSLVRLVLVRRAAPVTRSTRGTFELRFDAGHFSCTGAGTPEVRIELARVRSFTGGRRLSIELTDAPAATLPLTLPSKNNSPLASRLNDLLSASRAASSRAW